VPAAIRFALDGEMLPYLLVKDLILQVILQDLILHFLILEIALVVMCNFLTIVL
jgi:hypothetical protein